MYIGCYNFELPILKLFVKYIYINNNMTIKSDKRLVTKKTDKNNIGISAEIQVKIGVDSVSIGQL